MKIIDLEYEEVVLIIRLIKSDTKDYKGTSNYIARIKQSILEKLK